jgi:hypothetical protein
MPTLTRALHCLLAVVLYAAVLAVGYAPNPDACCLHVLQAARACQAWWLVQLAQLAPAAKVDFHSVLAEGWLSDQSAAQ